MDNSRFIEKAKLCVQAVSDEFKVEELYVVWFCKTLQNWKALISTDIVGGYYFEVTYNGNKGEAYVDVYNKSANVCVKDNDS